MCARHIWQQSMPPSSGLQPKSGIWKERSDSTSREQIERPWRNRGCFTEKGIPNPTQKGSFLDSRGWLTGHHPNILACVGMSFPCPLKLLARSCTMQACRWRAVACPTCEEPAAQRHSEFLGDIFFGQLNHRVEVFFVAKAYKSGEAIFGGQGG